MKKDKSSFIDKRIGAMTVEQKVGQCLVIGFVGSVVTPQILRRIRTYCPAGIRCGLTFRVKTAVHDPTAVGDNRFAARVVRKPKGTVKDYLTGFPVPHCTNEEYCRFLNTLKREALENGVGIPLHITLDMEGDSSADYNRGGIHYFPSAMGQALTGDPKLVRDVAWSVARQVTPLGFSWIHSPVLDVNTNPLNPEIGTRSYGENPEDAARFALEAFKGLAKGGLITTGKHFPARGPSAADAHEGLPVIDASRQELEKHLLPYRKLIEAGLPCVMTAHSAYPALDSSGLAATLSKPILTDLLKKELGFKGTITTDDITMGGIIQTFEVADACITALNAGADLVLFRDESPLIDEVYPLLVKAVLDGRLPEERLNDAVARTLSVKYDYGFFDEKPLRSEAKAGEGIEDSKVARIVTDAARRCVRVMRDDAKMLPLKSSQRVLLVEQVNPLHRLTNSQSCHPGILWEHMLRHSEQVAMVETNLQFCDSDRQRVLERLGEADVVVITDYYYRNQKRQAAFVDELHALGKPVAVITNTHYPTAVRPSYKTVVVTYGVGPESMSAVAARLFGERD